MLLSVQIANKCKSNTKSRVVHFKKSQFLLEVGRINMDFLVGFHRTQKQYDSILVGVDRLTKSSHFIPVKSTYSAEDCARIFIDDIMCHHGIPLFIISDRGAQFTSRFWSSSQKGLGTKVK